MQFLSAFFVVLVSASSALAGIHGADSRNLMAFQDYSLIELDRPVRATTPVKISHRKSIAADEQVFI